MPAKGIKVPDFCQAAAFEAAAGRDAALCQQYRGTQSLSRGMKVGYLYGLGPRSGDLLC